MATTFKRESLLEHKGHEYGRISNPTRDTLEENLASLEKAKYAVTYASGLGAVSSTFFILKSGDHIVSIVNCFKFLFFYLINIQFKLTILKRMTAIVERMYSFEILPKIWAWK